MKREERGVEEIWESRALLTVEIVQLNKKRIPI